MSVEVRVVVPRKLYIKLAEIAQKREMSVNDLIIYALGKVVSEWGT